MKIIPAIVIAAAMMLEMSSAQAASGTSYLLSSPVWSRDGQDHANLDLWLDPKAISAIDVTLSVIGGSGTVIPVNSISCGPYYSGQNSYVLLPGMSCHISVNVRNNLATAKVRVFSANTAEIKQFVRAGLDVRDAGENSLIHAEVR